MDEFLRSASQIYAAVYFGVIILVSFLEGIFPRRKETNSRGLRWFGNFGISIFGTIAARLAFPLAGVAWAIYCAERGWGVFNRLPVPFALSFVLTLVLLDLQAYSQHSLFHGLPLLWRLHRAHHTDHDCDFSTGARFHPLETILTTLFGLVVIAALGAPPVAVLVAQLVSTAVGFAEHANVRLPASLDRALRLLLVTPDMHRIHHSQEVGESRRNLGGTFTWWDRLFGTYVDSPVRGQDGIVFGVEGFRDRKHLSLAWMLAQPFLRNDGRLRSTSDRR
jgi:sterol desaturase/sphingolipid hydroxylase (fatty acid hydroxylase superfamily)